MKKPVVLLAVAVGVLFLILAVVYFVEPAKALPSFLPGFDAKLATHHYKHGIGALFLGLGAFAVAWFQSGPKKKTENAPVAM